MSVWNEQVLNAAAAAAKAALVQSLGVPADGTGDREVHKAALFASAAMVLDVLRETGASVTTFTGILRMLDETNAEPAQAKP